VWSGRNLLTFRRNVLPPSSGSKNKLAACFNDLLSDHDDGDFNKLVPDYKASHPRRCYYIRFVSQVDYIRNECIIWHYAYCEYSNLHNDVLGSVDSFLFCFSPVCTNLYFSTGIISIICADGRFPYQHGCKLFPYYHSFLESLSHLSSLRFFCFLSFKD
jgi:hypothetical protein